jgi:prepilin-type N-terminal cleavage/methylation domain-containing protein|eukprot:TRINITY_DN80203_c0_g1_i1.p1 TRINITY_DN80203_c0_g1~~TRINITY_DN80203_c0_g1_i1.p1  ORF type:complete len:139 (-),score=17.60 TRINITY_DN80203_c0_g1_i1:173-589(-)
MMRRRRAKRGFTLIELLVALAIISILAAITIPRFMVARYKAYLSACLVNERNIATALESYRSDNRLYPASTTILVQANFSGDISKLPTCPSAPGTDYSYEVASDGDSFTVSCSGYHHYQLQGHLAGFPQYTAAAGLKE